MVDRYSLDKNSEGYQDLTACKAIKRADNNRAVNRRINMKGEDLEQATLIQWCNLQSCKHKELDLIYAIPNGGYRNKAEARKLKATGTKAGVPDLHLPVPKMVNGILYGGLFIEMKFGNNKCTENQKKWIRRLQDQGYQCKICYSADEAIKVIKKYLGI